MSKFPSIGVMSTLMVVAVLPCGTRARGGWQTPVDVVNHSGTESAPYTADKIIDGVSGPGGAERNMAVFVDDTDPTSDPITGHIILDLGETKVAVRLKLWARNDSSEALFPKSMDVFCFADGDWSNNAVVDNIEGDVDILPLWSGTLESLTLGADQTVDFDIPAIARYIGMRINSSYGWDSFQIGEVAVDVSPIPEPGASAWLISGVIGLVMLRRRKR